MTEPLVLQALRPAAGGAVAHAPDGRVVFVRGALAGERVRVRVLNDDRVLRGEVVEVLDAAADRVPPPCPYAVPGACGGCDLQHASDQGQLEWKRQVLTDQLGRIGGLSFDGEVRAAGAAHGSRVRLRAVANGQGRLGLRRWRSHDLVPLERCDLVDERLAPAFGTVWPADASVEIRAIGPGAPLAVVRTRDGALTVTDLEGDELALTVRDVVVSNVTFSVSPHSFFQSHRSAPALLAEAVAAHATPAASCRLVDLYGGVGLFGLTALAVHPFEELLIVESSPSASRDAMHNGADDDRVQVHRASVDAHLVAASVREGDVVVLDPPRSGAGVATMTALCAARPSRVVYVSCDAPTLARDLRAAMNAGYWVRELRAWDLFPWTEHVELLAVLDAPSS